MDVNDIEEQDKQHVYIYIFICERKEKKLGKYNHISHRLIPNNYILRMINIQHRSRILYAYFHSITLLFDMEVC